MRLSRGSHLSGVHHRVGRAHACISHEPTAEGDAGGVHKRCGGSSGRCVLLGCMGAHPSTVTYKESFTCLCSVSLDQAVLVLFLALILFPRYSHQDLDDPWLKAAKGI